MFVKACLNGARRPGEHPSLPVTPAELAADAVAVRAAGAAAVHLHVKDSEGTDTFAGGDLAAVLTAVRNAAPGLAVGVTTGAWALPDPEERVAAIRAWPVVPDFASVNWHEEGADEVAVALLDGGVAVEAGLWHADAVEAWLASPLRDRCCRMLIELPDGLNADAAAAAADQLLALVKEGTQGRPAADIPRLLHGEGSSCWPALRDAGRRGLATRIGLEDVLHLPDGSPAQDNAALVAAALHLLQTRRPGS